MLSLHNVGHLRGLPESQHFLGVAMTQRRRAFASHGRLWCIKKPIKVIIWERNVLSFFTFFPFFFKILLLGGPVNVKHDFSMFKDLMVCGVVFMLWIKIIKSTIYMLLLLSNEIER
ncbi:hypothetical protein L1049_000437 [Liquidambar formosana]|uniref:Uncharacterized protein n=1 Tax=Liquidambar formosana TaxID=63359 RepID=A0AAP0R2V5_LIQFO